MNRIGEIGLKYLVVLIVVSLVVGSGVYVYQKRAAKKAAIKRRPRKAQGQFDVLGKEQDNLEAPFSGLNNFQTIKVDRDPSVQTEEVLDNASFTWQVANGTDLGLEKATSIVYFELDDGAIRKAELNLNDETGGTVFENNVSIESMALYNYEKAVDEGSLSAGKVQEIAAEEASAEADLGTLSEGKYAVKITYEFNSYTSAPSAEGTKVQLSQLNIEGTTQGDVDSAEAPINIETK